MNMKHTPGPWEQFRDSRGNVRIHGNVQGGPIAFVEELDNTGGTEQDHANARLIAAAPELLDICERLNAYNALMVSAVDRAALRAAIAKATGETI